MIFNESNCIELKGKLSETLAKELVSYLNTEDATIYVGVNKRGVVEGIKEEDVDRVMIQISDIFTDQISPDAMRFLYQHKEIIDGKAIIQIDIKKGDKLFYIKKYGLSERGCYIRVGTTCKSLKTEEIQRRYIETLVLPEKDITEIESSRDDLTFQILKNYLITNNYHFTESTFEKNLKLRTSKGKYNYMAEILADKNDIVINVATFAGKDKTEYLKRDEFGGVCLLYAMEKAKDYVESSFNQTFIKLGEGTRKEKKIYDNEAFEQAWYNACVYNK